MTIAYWDVEVQVLIQTMTAGRTRPLLCRCAGHQVQTDIADHTQSQSAEELGEFVVKRVGGEMSERGRLCEFAAGLLGQALDAPVVEPAVVTIPDSLAPSLPSVAQPNPPARGVRQFGSKFLGSGWNTYAVGKYLEKPLLDSALAIYVFDLLTQNVDRRTERPNVLTDGKVIRAYDHELAFSFLPPVFGRPTEPWQVQHQKFSTEHVFYQHLKGRTVDLEPCIECLRQMDRAIIGTVFQAVPQDWSTEDLGLIVDHLESIRANADKFADEIKRILSS